MIEILYEDNHLLVVVKKENIPVQADISGDVDLLTILKKYLKDKYQKPRNVYLGLVHRLDRPVSGIMVFAKTSKAASRLSEQVRNKSFGKQYHAIIVGKMDKNKGTLYDKLIKDTKTNIVTVSKFGKDSYLDYEVLDYKDNLSLVKIDLKTGRSHQIRVQFSSRNHPLYGDQKYNKNASKSQICLFASKLSFYHPITKEKMEFEYKLPSYYPWNLFK